MREATKEYQREEDLVADFIEERCTIDSEARVSAKEIYSNFTSWYEETISKKIPSQKWLGKELRKKFETVKTDGRITYSGINISNKC